MSFFSWKIYIIYLHVFIFIYLYVRKSSVRTIPPELLSFSTTNDKKQLILLQVRVFMISSPPTFKLDNPNPTPNSTLKPSQP